VLTAAALIWQRILKFVGSLCEKDDTSKVKSLVKLALKELFL